VDATPTGINREGIEVVDYKLEVVVIPVLDVDRAKEFYGSLGWRLDADIAAARHQLAGRGVEVNRRAAAAHGEHEQRTGGQRDENWPDWYAEYMVAEQAGTGLPT
jgi:catechol 2,3-dioxygenase-like lactoylglutathione lyase family enzyme